MSFTPDNRMAQGVSRKLGRPANTPTPPFIEAPPLLIPDTILPHVCPMCGRGQTPTIERREANGERSVRCNANGCRYVYKPASVRLKG